MDHDHHDTSKEKLHTKMEALHEELAIKIEEYGSKIRNTTQGSRNELTGLLNKLKKDQFTIRQYLTEIEGTGETDWDSFREKAEKDTSDIRDNLANDVPSSL